MHARRWIKVSLVFRRSRGRRYVMRWTDTAGKRHEQAVPPRIRNRRQAETFARRFEETLNGQGDQVPEPVTLKRLVTDFLAARESKGVRPRTLATYKTILEGFAQQVGPADAAAVTGRDVEMYLAGRDVAQATRRRDWVHLRALFRWAVKTCRLGRNPMDAVDAPRVPKPEPKALTPEQAARFLAAAAKRPEAVAQEKGPECPTWAEAAIRLATLGGLRIGELAALKAGHLDWTAKTLHVPAQKSAEARVISLDERTLGLLWELRHRADRPILWGPLAEPFLTRYTFEKQLRAEIRKTCQAAKVPDLDKPAHDLRRTCATLLAWARVPDLALAEFMGHQSLQTTRAFYVAADAQRAAEAARKGLAEMLPEAFDTSELGGKLVARDEAEETADEGDVDGQDG